jgi:quinol monooxygenase YgiN
VDPARVEEALTVLREENVPSVKGADGLCSFQLLLDRESGSGVIVTAWENQAAAEAFWPTAQRLRARVSEGAGVRVGAVESFTLIRTTARLD